MRVLHYYKRIKNNLPTYSIMLKILCRILNVFNFDTPAPIEMQIAKYYCEFGIFSFILFCHILLSYGKLLGIVELDVKFSASLIMPIRAGVVT